jgi:hypothetical protein
MIAIQMPVCTNSSKSACMCVLPKVQEKAKVQTKLGECLCRGATLPFLFSEKGENCTWATDSNVGE